MTDARELASAITHQVMEELEGKNVAFDVDWPNPEEMSLSLSLAGFDIVERVIRKALERDKSSRELDLSDANLVEPSDAERATWPEASENYVAGLERLVERPRDMLLAAGRLAEAAIIEERKAKTRVADLEVLVENLRRLASSREAREATARELAGQVSREKRFELALEEIEALALGPDRGSAAWQAHYAHEIAAIALDRPNYTHKARLSIYRVIKAGRLQTSRPLEDGAELLAYYGADGAIWFRPPGEFYDGRFEELEKRPGTAAEPSEAQS